ncbi:ATP-binding protein [Marinactinospora thermotolerans]|uniref:Anti-sigma regulatory factor (Ser/Thr protein kinase) n=1 Tax=Marinactinospora thermotolerans DSM 45154 TaxID=1122192 RepID=A0A1T4TDV7_9ACTN|nr:ATP-binding protein [Marinactinospora thermotolerans]SKA38623.1 Anti-sigma regulatory factor (Ser/Thr protein kinase) [Marinactinospora thermotolerans DSM 45154]
MTVFSTRFPGVPESVAAARRFLVATLWTASEAVVPSGIIEDAELIVSELATNAIQHTRSGDPGGTFELHVDVGERGVSVNIRTGPPRVRGPVRVRKAPADSTRGRGLLLVTALAAEYRTLEPLEHGTFVLLTWSARPDRRSREGTGQEGAAHHGEDAPPCGERPSLPRRDTTRRYWPQQLRCLRPTARQHQGDNTRLDL